MLGTAAVLTLWQACAGRGTQRAIRALAAEDAGRRAWGYAHLARAGDGAVPDLVDALRLAEQPAFAAALPGIMMSLRDLDRETVMPALIDALDDEQGAQRHYAGMTLAFIGTDVLPAVTERLQVAPDPSTRAAAAWILSWLGPAAVEAEPALQRALQDEHKDVRHTARYALSRLRKPNDGFWRAADRVRGATFGAEADGAAVALLPVVADGRQLAEFAVGLVLLAGIMRWALGRARMPGGRDAPRGADGPRRASLVRRIALGAGALAVALLVCEYGFRWLGPRALVDPKLLLPSGERIPLSEIALLRPEGGPEAGEGLAARFRPYLFMKGWYDRPQWDYFDEQDCVDYVFNKHGLRDNDFELEPRPDEYRVVAIGDSFTFGAGVQLQDCWTEVLERELEAVHEGPVEVINAGFVSGHKPPGYAPWLARDGVRLQPDVVLVGLCLNDLHPKISLYAYRKVRPVPWFEGAFELLNYVQRRHVNRDPELRRFFGYVKHDPSYWNETSAALVRTRDDMRAAGIRFVVVILPVVSGFGDDYPYHSLINMVAEFCASEGIEHVDLRERVLVGDERELWVHPTDQHPNDRGQRLIGEGVFEYLFGD